MAWARSDRDCSATAFNAVVLPANAISPSPTNIKLFNTPVQTPTACQATSQVQQTALQPCATAHCLLQLIYGPDLITGPSSRFTLGTMISGIVRAAPAYSCGDHAMGLHCQDIQHVAKSTVWAPIRYAAMHVNPHRCDRAFNAPAGC